MSAVLNIFGARSLLRKDKAFVKIDEKFLLDELLFSLPKDFFIFSVLGNVILNKNTIGVIKQLYKLDYHIALDSISLDKASFLEYEILFKKLSFIKIVSSFSI